MAIRPMIETPEYAAAVTAAGGQCEGIVKGSRCEHTNRVWRLYALPYLPVGPKRLIVLCDPCAKKREARLRKAERDSQAHHAQDDSEPTLF